MDGSLCRIGVFYDGSYFACAQNHFYADRNLGWLGFHPFHALIDTFAREWEQGFTNYRIVCATWHQGLFSSSQADERQLRNDRNKHLDLIHAGIEPKLIPMSQSQGEKGVDVALAIEALQAALSGTIDLAILVTGDGDFVPLARALMRRGVRVGVVYFHYEMGTAKAFANERLLSAANYSLDVNSLENERRHQGLFRGLFANGYKSAPAEKLPKVVTAA
ncbi:MAG: NYN domain-containing protein [Anaerolineales bacterium]